MSKILQIRNSTAEFLTFLTENREDGVQVVYKNETIWATQSAMAELFDCSSDNIGLHIPCELNQGRTVPAVVYVHPAAVCCTRICG